MKKTFLLFCALAFAPLLQGQNHKQEFIATDINNFWAAHEKIVSTKDTVLQRQILRELYLDKATDGLKRLIEARNYSEKEFLDAINNYPKFWNSIKANTLKSKDYYAEIEADIEKLAQAYPDLKPSTIYFGIGVFRTNGTAHENKVLIGSEIALSSKIVDISELPEHPKEFNTLYNPIDDIAFLCTHEYIHTQQGEMAHNLLSYCIYEGIAEFISTLVTGKKSYLAAIDFSEKNYLKVRDKFEEDIYIPSRTYNWLWSTNKIFGERDLGYAVGYGMAKKYYDNAQDKAKAIKKMIELDYSNENEVERFVDESGYLSKPLQTLYNEHERLRPFVEAIAPFENGSKTVKPGLTKITITFSEPLNENNTGIDFGPLGEGFMPKISPERIWSLHGKSWTFEVDLKPKQRYQILISNNFRNEKDLPLKPFLIDLETIE